MNDWSDAETHVERAHELFERGRWDEAEQELRHALAINPFRPEWHFNLGVTLEAAGRYREAIDAFTDCHNLDTDDANVVLLLGVNSLRTDDVSGAIAWLQKAQKLNPAAADSYVHRVEAYARLGDHENAELMFYLAQQFDPTSAGAYANLAESLLARGMNDRAVWCLREAANHDPQMPRIHARLAEAYASTGRLERARQLLFRELRNNPGDVNVLVDLGCLLAEMGQLAESAEKFRRVLEIEPDHAEAHFFLGDLAERQSRPADALEHFGVALRLDHEFVGARTRLALMLLRRNGETDADSARRLLREQVAALRQDGVSTDAPDSESAAQARSRFSSTDVVALGRALIDARMLREARATLEQALRDAPDDSAALHSLSLACFQAGDRAAGIRHARRCVRLDSRNIAAMHNLAVAFARERRWGLARAWASRAVHADPDDASLRRLRLRLLISAVIDRVCRRRAGRSTKSA